MQALRGKLISLLILLASGGLLAGVADLLALRLERAQIMATFRDVLSERRHDLEKELVQRRGTLRALGALFEASEEVTREEFRRFTRRVLADGSSIAALQWAPRVRREELAAHEEAARRSGVEGYRVTRRAPDGSLIPVDGADGVFFPELFSEPMTGNASEFGVDLNADEICRAALIESATSGEVVLTLPVEVSRGGARVAATTAILGVRTGAGSSILDHELSGVVTMVLYYPDLIDKAFERLAPEVRAGVTFRLADRSPGAARMLYSNVDAEVWEARRRAIGEPLLETIEIGHRHLVITAFPTAAFLARHATLEPLLIAIGTLLLSTLVGGSFLAYTCRAQIAVTRAHDGLLRSVLTSLSEGVVVANREGEILFVNQVAQRLLGPIRGTPPNDWPAVCGLHLEDARTPCPVDRIPLVRAIHGEHVGFEHLFVRNDGNPDGVWLSISGSPLLDEFHHLDGGIAVIRDITDRRRAEAQIHRLSAAVEQAADMVLITDRHGRIVYVNPAFERITGWSAEEAVGQTPRLLKSGRHDREFYAEMWRTLLAGDSYQGTIMNRCKGGSIFYAQHNITPIKDHCDGSTYFVSVCRDISDLRDREAHEFEMRLAATIQARLYPRDPPHVDGLDIAGACIPANAICGDYYDFIPLQGGALGLVVGDISGRGLGPALMMAETRAYLRSLLTFDADSCTAMRQLDAWLAPDLTEDTFVTLIAAVIDPSTRALTYVNAGHRPAVVLDASGSTKLEMSRAGVALGITPGYEYRCSEPLQLAHGDTVVMLTDGVLDARSATGAVFGMGRVLQVVRGYRRESAASIVQRLRQALDEFADGAPRDDDQTIVICRAVAGPGEHGEAATVQQEFAACGFHRSAAIPLDVMVDGDHLDDGVIRCSDSQSTLPPS